MKTLAFMTLVLLLAYSTNAQMSLQDPSPLANLDRNMEYMQYKPVPAIRERSPTHYGSAAVLFGTFLINHMIIESSKSRRDLETNIKKAGRVYLVGVTLTTGVFIFENRKARWEKLYDDQEQEKRWNACN